MEIVTGSIILAVIILIAVALFGKKKTKPIGSFPETYRRLLNEHVAFYKELDHANKTRFEDRMLLFLSRVRVTGIKTIVEDLIKLIIF